jgi:hypothetical protein
MVGASARNAVAAGDKARWLADKPSLIARVRSETLEGSGAE